MPHATQPTRRKWNPAAQQFSPHWNRAVAEVDPTEVVSLLDALDSPGEAAYSLEARERFARLSAELAWLRRHSDEPVLDLTRRVITTIGLDVEVTATPEFARTSRRDQLGAFLDAVAAYVDVDGDASLAGLLGYLQAESDQGVGLEQAVPSDREAVKLLTVHKAKGLEWEAVFLPALMKGVFPSDRVTDNWVMNPAVLPADLRGDAESIPQLAEATYAGMSRLQAATHPSAAAGRGQAGLRRGHPRKAAAGRHRPFLAFRSPQCPSSLQLSAGDRRGGDPSQSAARRGRATRTGQSIGR